MFSTSRGHLLVGGVPITRAEREQQSHEAFLANEMVRAMAAGYRNIRAPKVRARAAARRPSAQEAEQRQQEAEGMALYEALMRGGSARPAARQAPRAARVDRSADIRARHRRHVTDEANRKTRDRREFTNWSLGIR